MSKELKAAIEANDPAATKTALKKVKDINRKLPGADKPLRYACLHGADRVVEVLVKAGARLPREFDPAEDPFVLAAENEQTKVLERMIALGLPSQEVIHRALADAAMEGRLSVFDCLLDELRPPITAKLFRLATDGKNPALIKSLLRRGGDINAQEKDKWSNPGYTPMHSAAEGGKAEDLKMLAAHGANPNARTPAGVTPLMALMDSTMVCMQALSETLDSIKTLLSLGADASLTDDYGNDALCYYETNLGPSAEPDQTIRSTLLKAGAQGMTATGELFHALLSNDSERLRRAISAGADGNRIRPDLATPLLCTINSLELTEILLKAGANPNRGVDQFPIVGAAGMGNLDVVKALIAGGADIHVLEDDEEYKQNAFTAAELNGNHAVVAYLRSLGAGRPKPNRSTLLEPGVGSWNDFNEILVKSDVPTVANALAELLQGTVEPGVFGKSLIPGDSAYVVTRPKGMHWSNVFRITPELDRVAFPKNTVPFARKLASLAEAPVLLVAYSDTSDAVSVVRVSVDGKTKFDDGWDYDSLRELVDSAGRQASLGARKRLKTMKKDTPTSTARLNQLAEAERFAVAQFEIRGERGFALEIQFGDLAACVFEDVAFISK